MVEIQLDYLREVYNQLVPAKLPTARYCDNPHPLYVTEAHCPPRKAPEIPRRDF
jgi:hypothetical protein